MTQDQVFRIGAFWYVSVNGRTVGPWTRREYAMAGLQTEQRRALTQETRRAAMAALGQAILASNTTQIVEARTALRELDAQ